MTALGLVSGQEDNDVARYDWRSIHCSPYVVVLELSLFLLKKNPLSHINHPYDLSREHR